MAVIIRELTSEDVAFLRRMLCTALFWRRKWLPDWVALRLRQVAIYHERWGRPGDTGFVAEEDGTPIGAVWYRFFTEDEHGEGYVDAQTPELAIAVVKGRRGRGVGSRLFGAIHEQARRDGVRRISLSVDPDNPARRLYAALGYSEYEAPDENGRMILELAEPAPSTPERVNAQ